MKKKPIQLELPFGDQAVRPRRRSIRPAEEEAAYEGNKAELYARSYSDYMQDLDLENDE